MTSDGWVHRYTKHAPQRPGNTPEEILQVKAAAQDLAEQARHVPRGVGHVFQTAAQVALGVSAIVTGAFAMTKLWHSLSRPSHAPGPQYAQHHPRSHRPDYARESQHDRHRGRG